MREPDPVQRVHAATLATLVLWRGEGPGLLHADGVLVVHPT
jgi:hypothetical protein